MNDPEAKHSKSECNNIKRYKDGNYPNDGAKYDKNI
jgi:hypothetical protein